MITVSDSRPTVISRRAISLLCLVLVAVIGAADYLTGYEISFSIFYLVPVALAAWYGKRHYGTVLATVSSIVWLAMDATAGHRYVSVAILIWNAAVRFGFFIVIARLITSQKQQLIRERESARIDHLTGVLNMNGFLQEAGILWELARRYEHTTAVGYIDLDNFKCVNDTHGHAMGDALLKSIASVIRESLRSTDVIGRLGGDEFAVILPETSREDAEKVFRKIHEKQLQQVRMKGCLVTLSIGITVFHASYPSLEEALKNSDDLMYRIKRTGRNNILIEELPGEQT